MLSAANSIFLNSWGFTGLYSVYRDRLLTISKGTFRRLKSNSSLIPDSLDLAPHLEIALIISVVFADIVADLCTRSGVPGPNDPFWPYYFAEPVAQFLIDLEWQDIVN
jgi:hypothetical protein